MESNEIKATHEVDKSKWLLGDWNDEPDLLNYKTAEGFDAAIIRQSHGGHLCGYVGVPADHPWHGKEYGAAITPTKEQLERPVDMDKISILSLFASALSGEEADMSRLDCVISVHGGLSFSDCGNATYGKDPGLWYFGFDCAHSGDLSPGYGSHYISHASYKNIQYVKAEIASLSRQLAAVAPKPDVTPKRIRDW